MSDSNGNKVVEACSWPDCFSLSTHRYSSKGWCKLHYYKHRWLVQGRPYHERIRAERRGRLLAEWLTRPRQRFNAHRVRDGNLPPLTKRQQRIYDQELARLLQKHQPKTQVRVAQLCGYASVLARAGGHKALHHRRAIEARMAGWRRKWLRLGNYDPRFLEGIDIPHD